jgi:hypothetical protein
MKRARGSHWPTPLPLALLLTLLPAVVSAAACGRQKPSPVLKQEELNDPRRIAEARQMVTDAHRHAARSLEREGRQMLAERRYGPAAKALGEVALWDPNSERLLLDAYAFARVPRPRDDPKEEASARTHGIAAAERQLRAALELGPSQAVRLAIEKELGCHTGLREGGPSADCMQPPPATSLIEPKQ